QKHIQAEALLWSLERGTRSGRVAYQFVRHYLGQKGLEESQHTTD
ncbi:MAG: DUF815 domain-containing protein, partial [Gammaproteobacteria bacterium]|nr:DUF815 domain-containing protein [Gammaproteobacteria bacterium]